MTFEKSTKIFYTVPKVAEPEPEPVGTVFIWGLQNRKPEP
jgi:hypothetical protein